jgi:hypothetical protein
MRTSAVPISSVSTAVTRVVTEPLPHVPVTIVGEGVGSVGRCADVDATAQEPIWKS